MKAVSLVLWPNLGTLAIESLDVLLQQIGKLLKYDLVVLHSIVSAESLSNYMRFKQQPHHTSYQRFS